MRRLPGNARRTAGWSADSPPIRDLQDEYGDAGLSWTAHAFEIRRLDGLIHYVSETYGLDDDQLDQIAYLRRRGYRVEVSASDATLGPGRYLAVIFTPQEHVSR